MNITEVEHAPRCLRTDHTDLDQIHHPDPQTDIEETFSALTDLVHSGKVRAIGSSSAPASEIVGAQWSADRLAPRRLRTEQPTYSILNRGIERDVLPTCPHYGMGTPLVWSPQATGLFTGRYRKGRPAARIVAPGTDLGPLDVSCTPPAVTHAALRRRPTDERAAA